MPNIRNRLLSGVDVGTLEEGHSETLRGDDSPTGKPTILINDSMYTGRARDKMIAAESIHLWKDVDPEGHKKLLDTALADPEYMEWTQRSFDYLTGKIPNPETGKFDIPKDKLETRDFDQWHEVSRFDQVIGGYIYAQDPDLPTMKDWDRYTLPIGTDLRAGLEGFREDFETPQIADPRKKY